MKLSKHDLNVRLSDKDTEPAGGRLMPRERHGLYASIVRYPGRNVTADAAYKRMRRNPNMTLKDACEKPSNNAKSKIPRVKMDKPFVDQVPPKYVDDLRSGKPNTLIAKTWCTTDLTVARHKKLLREYDAKRTV